nr:MAG TPA: hypothetical protein [Caudoviricetes sp.]
MNIMHEYLCKKSFLTYGFLDIYAYFSPKNE